MKRIALVCFAGVLTACIPIRAAEPPPAETKPAESKPAEPKPAEPKPAEPNPAEPQPSPASAVASPVSPGDEQIRLHLMDGALIAGKLTVSEIEVETDFGKLTVPVARIRSLRPGMKSHPQLGRRIKELVEELGASQFERRETAQKELLKLGQPARAELEAREEDRDTERRARIKAILAELDQSEESAGDVDGEDRAGGPMRDSDAVETTDFTIVGRIVPQEFAIDSPYGRLSVKLSDIRNAERDFAGKQQTLHKTLAVEGQFLVPAGMKDSQIQLAKGDKVTVSAAGLITMTPWGNQVSTPEGGANFGWYLQNQIPGGALVAKIGDGGPIFKVGSKLVFTADRSGALRFGVAIHQNQANQPFPGQYNLKIAVRRK